MNNLDIAKAIAKLEGVVVELAEWLDYDPVLISASDKVEYNPITDLALNCMLRDKYEVEVDYICEDLSVYYGEDGKSATSEFKSKEEIPREVCECILKANGLWVDA